MAALLNHLHGTASVVDADGTGHSQDTAFFSAASATPSSTAEDGDGEDTAQDEDTQILARSSRLWTSPTSSSGTEGYPGHAIKCLPNGMVSMPIPASPSPSVPTTPTTDVSCRSDTPDIQYTPRLHSRHRGTVSHNDDDAEHPPEKRPSVWNDRNASQPTQRDVGQEQTSADGHRPTHSGSMSTSSSRASPRPRAYIESWAAQFWYIIKDPSCSSNTFFANPHTGECQWQVEEGTIVLPPNPHSEWWQLLDQQTDLPYFYHTQSGKVVWERPTTGLIIPLVAVQKTVDERNSRSIDTDVSHTFRPSLAAHTESSSPTLEQLLSGRARCSILDRDRQLVARALASSPGPHALSPRQAQHVPSRNGTLHRALTQRPSIHFEGNRILPSSKTLLEHQNSVDMTSTLPKASSLGNLRAYGPQKNGTAVVSSKTTARVQPLTAVSLNQSYDSRRLTVRRQRDPAKRMAPNAASTLPASQSMPLYATTLSTPSKPERPLSIVDSVENSINRMQLSGRADPLASTSVDYYRFAEREFAIQRTGSFLFRRRLAVSALLKWQISALNAPLFPIEGKHLTREALQMFRVLQKIMGDRTHEGFTRGAEEGQRPYLPLFRKKSQNQNRDTGSQSSVNGSQSQLNKLHPSSGSSSDASVELGMEEKQKWMLDRATASAELRDEMYAQTLKQLTCNPRSTSVQRGWRWLAVLDSNAPLSGTDKMYPYVHIFLHQRTESQASPRSFLPPSNE